MMVLAGEMAGEAFDAFFGGLPSLDGPGPREFRKDGAGVATISAVKHAKRAPEYVHEAEDGYDFVFFNIFLLGEAFFLALPLRTPSTMDQHITPGTALRRTDSCPSCLTCFRYPSRHFHFRSEWVLD
jgi:hypothetical protein